VNKTRLEAFSDGVIAIILTIMVLELKVPKDETLTALAVLWPVYAAYGLSYWLVFRVWLTHHDIFETLQSVNRRIMLANGLLLFAASLIPFATAYAGEGHWRAALPVLLYGSVMAAVSLAFARLRSLASEEAGTPAQREANRVEMRKSIYFAVAFLAVAGLGFARPRLSLLAFALIPAIGQRFGRIRHRRAQTT
jgi:uncharacterized membrane protein